MIDATLDHLDEETIALVRLAAAIAGADEETVEDHLRSVVAHVPAPWVEELILQSHLFCGFPRALNAARQWRELSPAPDTADETDNPSARNGWRARGEHDAPCPHGGTRGAHHHARRAKSRTSAPPARTSPEQVTFRRRTFATPCGIMVTPLSKSPLA